MRIVLVKLGCSNYLFEEPLLANIKVGDRVICDTSRGEQEGTAVTESMFFDDEDPNNLHFMSVATGCKSPLKKIVGKYELRSYKD